MRYELNLESQIVQYNGAVQSIADKKAILTQLFSQGIYECISISNDGCEWTIEYRNTVNDLQKKLLFIMVTSEMRIEMIERKKSN